jgi:hypothetical protein
VKSVARLPRARTRDLVISDVDDETLVYDVERDQAHCLNHTAAFIWNRCDGKTTVREAAQALRSEFGMPVDEDIVRLALKQLERFRLIEPGRKSPALSRRDLMLKYAPAALALPVIISIVAPTPAQSGSCGGQGAPCGGSNPLCCAGCNCDGTCFCGGS